MSGTATSPGLTPLPLLPGKARIPGLRFRLARDSETRRRIEVEVPAAVFEGEVLAELRRIRRRVRLRGFRRGRVPMARLRPLYGAQAAEAVARRLLGRATRESLHELDVTPIEGPRVHLPEIPGKGPLKAELRFDVMPEIARVDYSGIALTARRTEVGENDIRETLERLRQEKSTPGPLGSRGIRDGDLVVGDLEEIEISGGRTRPAANAPARKTAEVAIRIGSGGYHPRLHEALQGARQGETVVATLRFGKDSPDRDRAGRTLRALYTVRQGQRPVPPPLDDSLAQAFGVDSLLALRGEIRDRLREKAKKDDERHLEAQLLGMLREKNPVEAPETLVRREVEGRMQELAAALTEGGRKPAGPEVEAAIRERLPQLREQSERAVRDALLLDAVARQEKITVRREAVAATVRKLARAAGKNEAAMRASMEKKNLLGVLRERKRREAAVAFLMKEIEVNSA